jgi:hypothetical protein
MLMRRVMLLIEIISVANFKIIKVIHESGFTHDIGQRWRGQ